MSVQNLNSYGPFHPQRRPLLSHPLSDPFADEGDPLGDNKDVGSSQNYIHIRIQQRNGRKTLTTLQGLPKGALLLPVVTPLLTPSQSTTPRSFSRRSRRFADP